MSQGPSLSVVIATHNRPASLSRLLEQVARQTLPPQVFEVVVVDDGSEPPARQAVHRLRLPYLVRVLEQPASGAAAARHRGALAADGEVLVFVDDDMQIPPGFLEAHRARHSEKERVVALGRILPGTTRSQAPLFERWHARRLAELFDTGGPATRRIRGNHLYSGNFSVRRSDYLAAGGFDESLAQSEDVELGLRLERAGLRFELAPGAESFHESDRASAQGFLERAERYGRFDLRIARKHPDAAHANPCRFLFELNVLSRPLLAASVASPQAAFVLSRAAYLAAAAIDRAGASRVALAGVTAAYGAAYYRGLRLECGTLSAALREIAAYASHPGAPAETMRAALARLRQFAEEIAADHAALRHYEERYGHASPARGPWTADVVQKIGLQILLAYRVMRLLRDAGFPTLARVASRLIRHLYGCDVHWNASIEPGVMVVHGMGMAIHGEARVGRGCTLFQNVTLGRGTDPLTRESGAPTLEDGVHVGPGAALIGPIRIGAGSKIMAGAVVTRSVPAGSVVESPSPEVRQRAVPPRPVGPGARNLADPSQPPAI